MRAGDEPGVEEEEVGLEVGEEVELSQATSSINQVRGWMGRVRVADSQKA